MQSTAVTTGKNGEPDNGNDYKTLHLVHTVMWERYSEFCLMDHRVPYLIHP